MGCVTFPVAAHFNASRERHPEPVTLRLLRALADHGGENAAGATLDRPDQRLIRTGTGQWNA
jgi:hypothetical protein